MADKPSKSELETLYNELQSSRKVGKHYGVTSGCILTWMKSYGIPRRPSSIEKSSVPEGWKPPKDELERLYLDELVTTRQIGEHYGVSKTQIVRWMKAFDIERRPALGLASRGLRKPTRDELYKLIREEYSGYRGVAAIYSCDPSMVRHWLIEYDIELPTRWYTLRNGEIPELPDNKELEHLYLDEGLSIEAIADRFNVSDGPIRALCDEYGITVRPDGWDGGKRLACNDGHEARSTYEKHVDDWLFENGIEHVCEPTLPSDRRYKADFLANGWYIEIWGVKSLPTYNKRKIKKQGMYRLGSLPLIEITTDDFSSRRRGNWKRKLRKCLQPAINQGQLPF